MYATGQGVAQDDGQALSWYRQAAERRHAEAQFNLAVRYGQGRGAGQDDRLAVWWYRQAADQGHAAAQFNLGVRYAHGIGVAQDLVEAYWWVNLAASGSSGEPLARYSEALDDLAAQMTTAQADRRQQRLQAWTEAFERRRKT
jgi:TPR repeat protein